jgi:hypothetical protein
VLVARLSKLRRFRGHDERAVRPEHFEQGFDRRNRTALRPTDLAERGVHHDDGARPQPELDEVRGE